MTTARRESESSMVQPSGSAGSARRGGGAGRRESLLAASMQHNDEKTRNINDALDEGHDSAGVPSMLDDGFCMGVRTYVEVIRD